VLALTLVSGHGIAQGVDTAEDRWARESRESREREERLRLELEQRGTESRRRASGLERALNRVAVVRANFDGAPNLGAGLLIGRDQERLYVVTANHVVRRGGVAAGWVDLTLKGKPTLALPAQVLDVHDPGHDIAVIAVDAPPRSEVDLCSDDFYATRDAVERGLAVLPVGHPNGVRWVLPASADAVMRVEGDQITFQSSVLSPGHSGGALLGTDGTWVGIVTADAAPFGMAVSAVAVVKDLIEWNLPILVENLGFRRLAKAIEDGDATALAPWLDRCDLDREGPDNVAFEYREVGRRIPLLLAVDKGRTGMVRMLLAAKASPNVSRNAGESALHLAAGKGFARITRLLIAAGANVDAVDGSRRTPLMLAAARKKLEVAQVLLDAGADVNAVSIRRETALSLSKDEALSELLRERGAK
jgi:hypothetical protein